MLHTHMHTGTETRAHQNLIATLSKRGKKQNCKKNECWIDEITQETLEQWSSRLQTPISAFLVTARENANSKLVRILPNFPSIWNHVQIIMISVFYENEKRSHRHCKIKSFQTSHTHSTLPIFTHRIINMKNNDSNFQMCMDMHYARLILRKFRKFLWDTFLVNILKKMSYIKHND